MKKVITYGTYDLLHHGHIALLKRAKALGDYLIVGVTADDFDKARGKLNVQQTLEERIAAVKGTGLADKIIIEEYEGQKIDDIKKYGVDIFTVGSDWEGFFDYLNEYCRVVYLPRTEGVSSSEIRARKTLRLGMVGYSSFLSKFYNEAGYVNTVDIAGICVPEKGILNDLKPKVQIYTDEYDELLDHVDAVYIHSHPNQHYEQCMKALEKGKSILCESPIALSRKEYDTLKNEAQKRHCVMMEAIRTAFIIAYRRMLLLLKSGKIGDVVSVDATCTSLTTDENSDPEKRWGAMKTWGSTALLPVLQVFGTNYKDLKFFSLYDRTFPSIDTFTKISLSYDHCTATIKTGTGVKSEGDLIVSGTKGYIYVPSPWWKTDYFEVRFENPSENKRYFYQLEGEGIRHELIAFSRAVAEKQPNDDIDQSVTESIVTIMDAFQTKK